MGMKRCSNGHFYDDMKYQQCPYCGISNMDASKTMPIIMQSQPGASADATVGRTVAMSPEEIAKRQAAAGDDGKTVGIMKKKTGIDPVVGWVVCVDGPSRGQDYRIKSERNFIGRDRSMDISIMGDESISRNNHAVISFNPKNGSFRLVPGDGHGLVFLNDEEVFVPVELNRGDIIELGQTKLMFIPLCGGDFSW